VILLGLPRRRYDSTAAVRDAVGAAADNVLRDSGRHVASASVAFGAIPRPARTTGGH